MSNKKQLRYLFQIKIIVSALILTFLSSAIYDIKADREAFLRAGCAETDYKKTRGIGAVKGITTKPCSSIPIIKTAGFPVPYIYDNLTKSGIGEISYIDDNIYFKPLLADFIFFIVLVLIIFGIKQSKILSSLIMLILLSFFLTVLSSNIPSHDVIAAYGEGYCGESSPCDVEVKTGGFPFKFLYDNLGSSVVGNLSLEDDWRTEPFLYNVAFYLVLLSGLRLFKNAAKKKAAE